MHLNNNVMTQFSRVRHNNIYTFHSAIIIRLLKLMICICCIKETRVLWIYTCSNNLHS